MEARKALPLLILVIVLVLSVIVWFYPPTGDFRVDNPSWNGLSVYSKLVRATPLSSFNSLPASVKGTAVILVPYEPFSQSELAQLKSYVSSGGTLVLLDDYGYGNQVLSGLGLDMRFSGHPLLDPLYNYRNEWLPKVTDFTSSTLNANVSSIVFNHATCLNETSGGTVIAQSSSFSFLSVNNNGAFSTGDVNGPFPMAAYVKIGQGYVVAVADPSLLINGMINLDNNLQFVNNVVSIQAANPRIFIDQSHLPTTPLDSSKAFLGVVYGVVASPLGTLSLIIVVLALTLKPLWLRRERA